MNIHKKDQKKPSGVAVGVFISVSGFGSQATMSIVIHQDL